MSDSSSPTQEEDDYSWTEPDSHFPIFRRDGKLYLSEGAELPAAICINCGKRSVKVVRKALRNPYNPLTWIGAKPRVRVGLCKKHKESFLTMRALAFSLLGVGLTIFILGLVNRAIDSIIVGAMTMFLCGLFRSLKPVWSPDTRVEPMEISGTGKQFREIYPDVSEEAE